MQYKETTIPNDGLIVKNYHGGTVSYGMYVCLCHVFFHSGVKMGVGDYQWLAMVMLVDIT